MSGSDYLVSVCNQGGKSTGYTLFNVYNGGSKPVAEIGVSRNDTGVFRETVGMTSSEASADSRNQDSSSPVPSAPSSSSSWSGSDQTSQPDPSETATPLRVNTTYAICPAKDGQQNVLDVTLKKTILTANEGEPVKMFDPIVKRNATVSGAITTFVQVTFPNRKQGQNTGWIPQSSVCMAS